MKSNLTLFCGLVVCLVGAVACTPTVKVEAPDKPIEINMNIKIEQDVKIRVEKNLDQDILNNPDLFGVPATDGKKAS